MIKGEGCWGCRGQMWAMDKVEKRKAGRPRKLINERLQLIEWLAQPDWLRTPRTQEEFAKLHHGTVGARL